MTTPTPDPKPLSDEGDTVFVERCTRDPNTCQMDICVRCWTKGEGHYVVRPRVTLKPEALRASGDVGEDDTGLRPALVDAIRGDGQWATFIRVKMPLNHTNQFSADSTEIIERLAKGVMAWMQDRGFRCVTADKGTVVEREELEQLLRSRCPHAFRDKMYGEDGCAQWACHCKIQADILVAHLTAKPTPSTGDES